MAPPKQSYMDSRLPEQNLYGPMPQLSAPPSQTPSVVPSITPVTTMSNDHANQIVPSVECSSPGLSAYDNLAGKRMMYHAAPNYGKRSHEDTFGLDERPMQNGMRPDAEPYEPAYRGYSGDSRAALMAELGIEMSYKRANGKTVMKSAVST